MLCEYECDIVECYNEILHLLSLLRPVILKLGVTRSFQGVEGCQNLPGVV